MLMLIYKSYVKFNNQMKKTVLEESKDAWGEINNAIKSGHFVLPVTPNKFDWPN